MCVMCLVYLCLCTCVCLYVFHEGICVYLRVYQCVCVVCISMLCVRCMYLCLCTSVYLGVWVCGWVWSRPWAHGLAYCWAALVQCMVCLVCSFVWFQGLNLGSQHASWPFYYWVRPQPSYFFILRQEFTHSGWAVSLARWRLAWACEKDVCCDTVAPA